MTHRRLLFTAFLIIYGGVLLAHVWEMGINSWQLATGLLGVTISLAAHRKHGYLPLAFIVGHMMIEWYHHALEGSHYNSGEITFYGVHAVLDMAFLYVEARAHFGRYAMPLLGAISLCMLVIFLGNAEGMHAIGNHAEKVAESAHQEHTHSEEGWIHYAVIGGMLGCILSQLFTMMRWKHPHQG